MQVPLQRSGFPPHPHTAKCTSARNELAIIGSHHLD
jgi:hypothetical protein